MQTYDEPRVTRSTSLTVAGWAGVVGPLLFTAAFLAQEAFRRDEFDPIAEPVSALEAGPNGWVQQANFVGFGVLTIAFALGLRRALAPSRATSVGWRLMLATGVLNVLAAVFPLREDASGATYDPGGHTVVGFVYFLSSALALVILSRAFGKDAHWSGLATHTLAAGILAVLGFVLMGALFVPDDAPLHDYAGLGQRVLILAIVFPCRIAIAVRLLRLASR